MKLFSLRSLVLALPLCLGLTGLSAEAARLAVVGAANFSKPEMTKSANNYQFTEKMTLGGGALLSFGSVVGLEFGALYTPRKSEYTSVLGSKVEETYNLVQFPVLIRAYLGDFLSLGVGGYYGRYTGDVEYQTTFANGIQTNSTSTYAAANRAEDDYGAVASIGIYIPFSPLTRFVIDGRYLAGMKDQNKGTAEEKFKDVLVLAGFQFGF